MAGSKVVVGVDFSSHGETAIIWAAQHAAAFGWELEALHVWSYPWWAAGPLSVGEDVRDEVASSAVRHLRTFVDRYMPEGAASPSIKVVEGDTAEQLCEAGADAEAIVLGTGGQRAISAWLTGAVGRRVAAATSVPLIIVPDDYVARRGPIVVGGDGSDNSARALRWACDHAAAGQDVRVVTSWTSNAAHLAGVVAVDLDLMETSARKQLESTLDKAALLGVDVTEVDTDVVYGDPRSVLREAQQDADMMVVGARGSSGLAGLLLGSVASSLIHRPATALVVVPDNDS